MTKQLNPKQTVWTGLVFSAVACWLTLWLQIGSFWWTMMYLVYTPTLLLLNWLPMALLCILLFSLTGSICVGGGLTTLIWGLLSYINLVKVMARGDPFVPGDVLLLFEGMEAAGSYELRYPIGKLVLLIGLSVGMMALGLVFKSPNLRPRTRIAGALAAVAVFVSAMMGPYASKDYYERLPGQSLSNIPGVFDCFGFPYCFLHNFNLNPVDCPEGYVLSEAEGYEELYRHERTVPENAPNILMIMCEAFTDLPNSQAFSYSEQDNPVAYFNSLTAREDTVSGQMIVSNVGAGTANTEFDVMTGMMTNRISPATTSAFRVVRRNTDSIARMLQEVGYRTFFTHPGQNWFYNRESVYSYLGITDQQFREVYGDGDFKGEWITDHAFLQKLTAALEERDTEAPIFAYGVTIQNHQAYTQEKYGFMPQRVQTDLPLTPEAEEYLNVYFEGLRDSDKMLQELVQWLEEQTEPWILVFFGDHQPNLGPDCLAFREIGEYPEDLEGAENRLSQYSVPYLIMGNTSFRETTILPQPEQTTISSHYLGAMTCSLAGFDGLDGYIDYVNDLRKVLPVCSVSGYMTADGQYHEELTGELWEKELLRWQWQYYRLKHQDLSKE